MVATALPPPFWSEKLSHVIEAVDERSLVHDRHPPPGIRAELGIPKCDARAAVSAPRGKPSAGVTIGIVQRGKELREGFEVVSGHGERTPSLVWTIPTASARYRL